MLRLMSNNQWRCDENKPYWIERGLDCSAQARAKGFARLYAETEPDIVGLQEVSPAMLEWLLRELSARGLPFGAVWGRDTPIIYRTDRFETVDQRFHIYSKTIPELEGEFNNYDTKSYCACVFREKRSGKLFTFMTTHLWWKSDDPASPDYQAGSDSARVHQLQCAIAALDDLAQRYRCPQVLVGDLNTPYSSAPIRAAFAAGFSHAHDVAVDYADQTNGWHPCGPNIIESYTPEDFKHGIDHILVRNCDIQFVRRFDRTMPDYYITLSDHAPVWIDAAP